MGEHSMGDQGAGLHGEKEGGWKAGAGEAECCRGHGLGALASGAGADTGREDPQRGCSMGRGARAGQRHPGLPALRFLGRVLRWCGFSLQPLLWLRGESVQGLPRNARQFLALVVSELCPKRNFKGKQLEVGEEGKGC